MSEKLLKNRAQSQQKEGLIDWNYDDPFREVAVSIDEMNKILEKRFLIEANKFLNSVIAEAASRENIIQNSNGNSDVQHSLWTWFNPFSLPLFWRTLKCSPILCRTTNERGKPVPNNLFLFLFFTWFMQFRMNLQVQFVTRRNMVTFSD